MRENIVECPGCGVQLYSANNNLDTDFNASTVCREMCYHISYYTLSLHDKDFIHQLVVDTYAAQHFGSGIKSVTIAFALVGLFLVQERNYTGKQVQQAHIALANKSKIWPSFSVPKEKKWLTVNDVVQVPDELKQEMIKKWSQSVWQIWRPEIEGVSAIVNKYLG